MHTLGIPLLAGLLIALVAACDSATPGPATGPVVDNVPFVDGERFVYELIDADGESIGTGELATTLEDTRWVLEQRYEGATETGEPAPTDDITLGVDANTLLPFAGLREIERPGDDGPVEREVYEWSYTTGEDGDRLEVTHDAGDGHDTDSLDLRDNYYDNEASLWLWRSLDFDEALDQNYVSVNPLEATQQTVNLQTPATETIEVPAGTFEVWRVIVRNGRAIRSAWINVEAPHQVVQWDNGDVIFRLESSELPGG
jgi:hypothetical protein